MQAASDCALPNTLFKKSVLAWRASYLTAKAEVVQLTAEDQPAATAAPPRPKIVRPGPRRPRRR